MNIVERNVSVNMIRNDLEHIPEHPLPPGISLRWYQPGDEQHWVDIHLLADPYNKIDLALWRREFGGDARILSQRQAFLVQEETGYVFGTATAWWDDDYYGQPYGRIHWVAIVPAMQGQGLARPLLSIVCRQLKALGSERAYLVTSTGRIPAINLYARFGFRPHIRTAEEREIWHQVQAYVRVPLGLDT